MASALRVVNGLLFPVVILAVDAAIRRISFAPLRPNWLLKPDYKQSESNNQDVLGWQVFALIALIACAVTVGWVVSAKLPENELKPLFSNMGM